MTEVLEICRVAGASYPDQTVATGNAETIQQLNDLALLSRMLDLAIDATGAPDADGTISYYGSRLTRDEHPQASERYMAIHNAVPEWTATNKIRGAIASLADRLSSASRNALHVPSIPNFPGNASHIQTWLTNILGNSTIRPWVDSGITQDSINARLGATGVSASDRAILENLLKLVQMRDVAQAATGNPAAPATMTGLGCQLTGANPNFCPGLTEDTDGTFDVYMTIHGAAPNNTATSKVRQTIVRLVNSLPQALRTELSIPANAETWVADLRTSDQAEALLARVNTEIVERCGTLNIGLVSASPASARQDQTVTVTINGVNLPEDSAVQFYLGTAEDRSITVGEVNVAANGNSLTVSITVAADAEVAARRIRVYSAGDTSRSGELTGGFSITSSTPTAPAIPATCTNGIDDDNDLLTDRVAGAEDPDCSEEAIAAGGEGEQALTGAALASYYLHNVLRTDLILALGGSSYTSGTVDGDVASGTPALPAQLRPALSTLYPNIGLTLNMGNIEQNRPVTIIGQHNPIAPGVAPDWVDLMFDMQFNYATYLQQAGGAGDEHMVDLGVGLQGRFRPQGNIYLDAFLGYDLDYNNYTTPNRLHFSGLDHQIHAGGAFGTDFGQNYLDARLFGRYERSWFSYDQETFGLFEFDGQTEGARFGLRLDVDGSSLHDNAPDGYLQASVLPWGNTYVPEYAPALGIDSHSLESTRAFNAELGIAWREWAINPFLTVGATGYWQGDSEVNEDWNPMYNIYGTAGVDTEVAGRFELGLLFGRNITLFSGGEQTGGSFTWTLPWLNRSFSLMGRMDQFNMGEYEELSGSGMILWDPLRTFLPVPPQGYDQ